MWKKRVAVVGSFWFIKNKHYELTQKLILNNLKHPHDLMHKANGWMLREIGKKDESVMLISSTSTIKKCREQAFAMLLKD
jgi:3-methyladenine DNA glycosylase AlkD